MAENNKGKQDPTIVTAVPIDQSVGGGATGPAPSRLLVGGGGGGGGGWRPHEAQKIDVSRGPPARLDYESIRLPLPDPPEDMEWTRDAETREWSLVPREREGKRPDGDGGGGEGGAPPRRDDVASGSTFVEHVVQPTDTLAGLCLRYKTNAIKIRQVNGFSGSNLLLAPSTLLIPLSGAEVGRRDAGPEAKVRSLRSRLGGDVVSDAEARAYLEMSDWDVDAAVRGAREDMEWEKLGGGSSGGGGVVNKST